MSLAERHLSLKAPFSSSVCHVGTNFSGMVPESQGVGSAGPIIPNDVPRPDDSPLPPAPHKMLQANQREALSSVQWVISPPGWGSSAPLAMWQGVKVEDDNVVDIELRGFTLKTGEIYIPHQSTLYMTVTSVIVLHQFCQIVPRLLGQRSISHSLRISILGANQVNRMLVPCDMGFVFADQGLTKRADGRKGSAYPFSHFAFSIPNNDECMVPKSYFYPTGVDSRFPMPWPGPLKFVSGTCESRRFS